MNSLISTTFYTVKILRRDKVFIPVFLLGGLFAVFAGMASGWAVDNYDRVLYDLGLAGYHMVGAAVAILWGAKIIGDFKTDGSIELQLAAPIQKTTWYLGRCFGLFIILAIIGLGLLAMWQLVLLQFDFNFSSGRQIIPFLLFILEWWILAALAFFFASFSSTTTSIFCTIIMWILGLTAEPFYQAVTEQTSPFIKEALWFLSKYWNFQRLNISDFAVVGEFPGTDYIAYSVLFATSLIVILLLSGCLLFQKRQLQ